MSFRIQSQWFMVCWLYKTWCRFSKFKPTVADANQIYSVPALMFILFVCVYYRSGLFSPKIDFFVSLNKLFVTLKIKLTYVPNLVVGNHEIF